MGFRKLKDFALESFDNCKLKIVSKIIIKPSFRQGLS